MVSSPRLCRLYGVQSDCLTATPSPFRMCIRLEVTSDMVLGTHGPDHGFQICRLWTAVIWDRTSQACGPTRSDSPAIDSPRVSDGTLCSFRFIWHFGRFYTRHVPSFQLEILPVLWLLLLISFWRKKVVIYLVIFLTPCGASRACCGQKGRSDQRVLFCSGTCTCEVTQPLAQVWGSMVLVIVMAHPNKTPGFLNRLLKQQLQFNWGPL